MSLENPRDVSRVVVTRFGWRFLGWELSCTSGKVHLLLRSQGSRQFWSQFKTLPSSVEASLETTLAIWSKKEYCNSQQNYFWSFKKTTQTDSFSKSLQNRKEFSHSRSLKKSFDFRLLHCSGLRPQVMRTNDSANPWEAEKNIEISISEAITFTQALPIKKM